MNDLDSFCEGISSALNNENHYNSPSLRERNSAVESSLTPIQATTSLACRNITNQFQETSTPTCGQSMSECALEIKNIVKSNKNTSYLPTPGTDEVTKWRMRVVRLVGILIRNKS
jgi:hypothetical protein